MHELEEELEAEREEVEEKCQELDKLRRGKRTHLDKWDWLEKEYHLKCQEAHCAQQSLEKAQEEFNEIMMLKDQRIEELESEFAAKNASIVEVKVHVHTSSHIFTDQPLFVLGGHVGIMGVSYCHWPRSAIFTMVYHLGP